MVGCWLDNAIDLGNRAHVSKLHLRKYTATVISEKSSGAETDA